MINSSFTKGFVEGLFDSTPLEKRANVGRWLKTLAVFGIPLAVGSYAFGRGITSGQGEREQREMETARQNALKSSYFGQ